MRAEDIPKRGYALMLIGIYKDPPLLRESTFHLYPTRKLARTALRDASEHLTSPGARWVIVPYARVERGRRGKR